MASSNTFHCSVVTPEKAILERDARFVAFPAHDGEIGIMRNRAPLLYRLGIGPMRVETENGVETLFIDGGFAQMVDNRLTILTEQAKWPSELDAREAKSALAEAQALTIADERSFVERQRAVARAHAQLKMAEKIEK